MQTEILNDYINENAPACIKARYAALADAAKRSDFGELDADVVVLDTETTGVSFKKDELIQIAAARMRGGEITEWYVTFVNPGRPIPEDIQHLTDIHESDVALAPSPQEALRGLVEFVGNSDIVAHNADFDKHFTTHLEEGEPLLDNVWIDSLDLARVALPRMKSHRLKDLIHAFGGPASTHRADDDVAATCVLYRVLLAAVAAMPSNLVVEISRMATEEEWPTVKVFKHFANQAAIEGTFGEPSGALGFSLRKLRWDRIKDIKRTFKADAGADEEDDVAFLDFPTEDEIAHEFTAEGALGLAYEDYEPRLEQVVMAKAVNKAFATSDNLVVEAGTGVGKSMAYLIPAVLSAKKNGLTVGVATKTNNLLDQLVNKELPLLDKTLGGVEFASLKGFSHYPCLRSIDKLVQEGPKMVEYQGETKHQACALAGLLSFVEQSEYDDIDTLKIDYRRMPRYLFTTNSNECLRRKCPFYGKSCYVHGARAKAELADVVVTNHSLLFCDLAADGGLLPTIRHWIVDEAHGAEAEGRRALSIELSADDILMLSRKVSSDTPSKNLFLRAERQLGAKRPAQEMEGASPLPGFSGTPGEAVTTLFALTAKARSAGKEFSQVADEFCSHMKDLLYFDPSSKNRGYEFVDLWINDSIRSSGTFRELASYAHMFADKAERLVGASQAVVSYLENFEKAAAIQREIAAAALELKEMIQACELILFAPTPIYAYSALLNKHKDKRVDKLSAMLVNIGDALNETLFEKTHSVVFTSATLSVDDSFDSIENALGLNKTEKSHATYLELASSYDFNANMKVYVVRDMPEPNESRYLDVLQDLLTRSHKASEGSTLTLFTNRKEMETCYGPVSDALKEDGLRVVCQRWGVSVKGLRDDFVSDKSLSLFALKSFWEGFDAPGDTLRTVVIPKLPFKKPSDPLSCERQQSDPQAWMHFVLPEAVIEMKQAAGRLIRSSTDKGCLVLADKRLITKGYGQKFLRSLPSQNISYVTIDELVAELEEFNKNR